LARSIRWWTRNRLLGLLCHFFIAFGAATVYFVASRAIRPLIQYAVVSGVLYGGRLFLYESHCAALSAAAKRPFS